MSLGFFALIRLPLPEAITLNYAQPLLVVVFSALFLGEAIRVYRWSAVAVGHGRRGRHVVAEADAVRGAAPASAEPRRSASSPPGLGRGVGGRAAVGAQLVRTEKSAPSCCGFRSPPALVGLAHFAVRLERAVGQPGACSWSACGLAGGHRSDADDGSLPPCRSLDGGAVRVHLAVDRHRRRLLVFGDRPTVNTLVGGAIVVAAGLFIIWREQQLGLKRGAGRRLTPTQG